VGQLKSGYQCSYYPSHLIFKNWKKPKFKVKFNQFGFHHQNWTGRTDIYVYRLYCHACILVLASQHNFKMAEISKKATVMLNICVKTVLRVCGRFPIPSLRRLMHCIIQPFLPREKDFHRHNPK
jgi:hypothetical protein